jgi:2-C-methyl-D-erythritol 4-phosphate cytidylyltransferase
MNITVIIPAAGLGKRFVSGGAPAVDALGLPAAPTSKIEIDLAGRAVFLRAIDLFQQRASQVGQILLAVNPDQVEEFRFKWGEKLAFSGVELVPGGRKERWETVLNAMKMVSAGVTHIAVHDAARPLASRRLVDRVFEAAQRFAAVIPALPVAGTLKRIDPREVKDDTIDPLDAILGAAGKPDLKAHRIIETVSRANLVEVQTPQVFEIGLFRRAYAQISEGTIDPSRITDDAGLVEALGEPVHMIEGETTNLKITRAEDAEFARALVQYREGRNAKEIATKKLFTDED